MIIAEPPPTGFDLKFRVGPFPTRVHPLFWVVAALMGQRALYSEYPFAFLGIWIAVVFVSILVHELGHAVLFRAFGSPARIWLYWFGGLAVSDRPPRDPVRSIAVFLAGPGAGFVLAAITFGTERLFGWAGENPFLRELYRQLMWVNVGWGVINLLPVLPLDGGRVCHEACRMLGVRRPEVTALKVSVATAVLVAVVTLLDYLGQPRDLVRQVPDEVRVRSLYLPILFGFLAFSSYQTLQAANRQSAAWGDTDDDTPPWRRRY